MQRIDTAPSRLLQTKANSKELKERGGMSWATNIFTRIFCPSWTQRLLRYGCAFMTPESMEVSPWNGRHFADKGRSGKGKTTILFSIPIIATMMSCRFSRNELFLWAPWWFPCNVTSMKVLYCRLNCFDNFCLFAGGTLWVVPDMKCPPDVLWLTHSGLKVRLG